MSAAPPSAGAQHFLHPHLQPRDCAALRCSGCCFIEVDGDAPVQVAVTAFHLIFLIAQDGAHASRLAWSDVATMQVSAAPHGRRTAILEFFVHESAPAKPSLSAPPSPGFSKLTKTAQLLEKDALAKAAAAKVPSLNARPLIMYIEDIPNQDDDSSIVIASHRAFLNFHFNKQLQQKLSTASLIHDDSALLNQFVALETEVAAAASADALLPLLEDIIIGAQNHSIKFCFFHRPLVINRLIQELKNARLPSVHPNPAAPKLPPLLSSVANISIATTVFRCFSAIAFGSCRFCVAHDPVAASSAKDCLLAAILPLTTEAHLADVNMRISLSALLKAQVEAVYNCLFLCFSAPCPVPLSSFLMQQILPEQVTSFVANSVYSLLRTASFLVGADVSSAPDGTNVDSSASSELPQTTPDATESISTSLFHRSEFKSPALSVDTSSLDCSPPASPNQLQPATTVISRRIQSLDVIQMYSVSVVQHLLLLLSLLPSAFAPQASSLLQPHEVELRFILRKQSLERMSRFMSPQMKRILFNAARDLIVTFSRESDETRPR